MNRNTPTTTPITRVTAALIVLFLAVCPSFSLLSAEKSYAIKAAWFGKFPMFITWPEKSGMKDTTKPFVIGVIGNNPFGPILEYAYADGKRKINNKKVSVKYFLSLNDISAIKSCHILFISPSEKKNLVEIIAITKKAPILTIGDTKGFAQIGVHINFYNSGKKLKLEINPTALREASLKASHHLLKFGTIVHPQGGRTR